MLNSNQMRDIDTDEDISSEMEGAYAHCRYVWRNVVRNLKNVEDIFMIGHSAGGSQITDILHSDFKFCRDKVKAVIFTDAVIGDIKDRVEKGGKKWLRDVCLQYVGDGRPTYTHRFPYKQTLQGTYGFRKPAWEMKNAICKEVCCGIDSHTLSTAYCWPDAMGRLDEILDHLENKKSYSFFKDLPKV